MSIDRSTTHRGLALAVAGLLSLAVAPAGAESVPLEADLQHSNVGFHVRHLFTKVHGSFRDFEATIQFDPNHPAASSVDATIQTASVDTAVEARDKDLRSKRFFDAETHPTIEFKSTSVTPVSDTKAKVRGNLTIRGVTKEVVLETEYLGKAADAWGNTKYGFHASTKIDRTAFGLNWNEVLEAGGVLVGNDVEIELDISAQPAKAN